VTNSIWVSSLGLGRGLSKGRERAGDLGHGVANKPSDPIPQVGPEVAGLEQQHILRPLGAAVTPVTQPPRHFLSRLAGAAGLELIPAQTPRCDTAHTPCLD